MTEQAGPRDLVRHAVGAEEVGFDFEVMSDHFSPWLTSQGHAPYAWSVLGAVAHATSRVGLMTYVTCPTIRYHPAVVAQKAATVQLLAEGRFTLGLGSGESLNEHVVGDGWPGDRDAPGDARRGGRDHPAAAHRRAGRPPRRLLRGRLRPDLGPPRDAGRARGRGRRRPRHRAASPRWPTTWSRSSRRPTLVSSWNAVDGRAADRRRRAGDRPDPDLLGPRRGGRGRRARTSSSAGSPAAGA